MHLRAKNLAIENPTKNLLEFMWKHFQLSKLVNQGNYFIVYEEFFDDACENSTYILHNIHFINNFFEFTEWKKILMK